MSLRFAGHVDLQDPGFMIPELPVLHGTSGGFRSNKTQQAGNTQVQNAIFTFPYQRRRRLCSYVSRIGGRY